jgi:hypothetical protein
VAVQNPTDAPAAPSLDGREFVMASSTASAVDPASPSRFRYHERDGVVWGDYDGDTVTFGRFVGRREGDSIDVSFVHVLVRDLAVVSGTSTSLVAVGEGEGLRLVEEFRIGDVEHVSVCVEAV